MTLVAEYAVPTSNSDAMHTMCAGKAAAGWTVVACYDGVDYEEPTDGLYANVTNQWRAGGTIGSYPSWILWRSAPAANGEQFDVYHRALNSGNWTAQMFPQGNFVPGGGTDASPTLPTPALTARSVHVTSTTAPRNYVFGPTLFICRTTNTDDSSQQHVYFGELNSLQDVDDWLYPFVSYGSSSFWNAGGTWQCLSPFDDTTVVTLEVHYNTSATPDAATLRASIIPLVLECTTASHDFSAGFAQAIGMGPDLSNNTRYTCGETLGVRDWMFFKGASGSATAAIKHDGTTLDSDLLRTRIPYDIELPEFSDSTPPQITNFVPSLATAVEATGTVQFDVTDNLTEFAAVVILADFRASGIYDVVHDGANWGPQYRGDSTRTAIAGGWRYVLRRRDGWPLGPKFRCAVVDLGGNEAEIP